MNFARFSRDRRAEAAHLFSRATASGCVAPPRKDSPAPSWATNVPRTTTRTFIRDRHALSALVLFAPPGRPIFSRDADEPQKFASAVTGAGRFVSFPPPPPRSGFPSSVICFFSRFSFCHPSLQPPPVARSPVFRIGGETMKSLSPMAIATGAESPTRTGRRDRRFLPPSPFPLLFSDLYKYIYIYL